MHLSPEEEANWRSLSAEEDACNAARCVYQQRNQCFLFRARRNADAAHLVVVNHALLLSDTVSGSRVLPEYEHLVVDEAHHLEDQATFGIFRCRALAEPPVCERQTAGP
jgi:DNA polymerase-3 subunit epsilon/ATP-dependent DNA helicase DinG